MKMEVVDRGLWRFLKMSSSEMKKKIPALSFISFVGFAIIG